MLLGAVLFGRSLDARQRLKAAKELQGLFDARPDQVGAAFMEQIAVNQPPTLPKIDRYRRAGALCMLNIERIPLPCCKVNDPNTW